MKMQRKKPISDLLPRFYNKDYVNEKGEKIRCCINCGEKLIPYIYKKKDGFPKLVGKSDGHTYKCKCSGKDLMICIG